MRGKSWIMLHRLPLIRPSATFSLREKGVSGELERIRFFIDYNFDVARTDKQFGYGVVNAVAPGSDGRILVGGDFTTYFAGCESAHAMILNNNGDFFQCFAPICPYTTTLPRRTIIAELTARVI